MVRGGFLLGSRAKGLEYVAWRPMVLVLTAQNEPVVGPNVGVEHINRNKENMNNFPRLQVI